MKKSIIFFLTLIISAVVIGQPNIQHHHINWNTSSGFKGQSDNNYLRLSFDGAKLMGSTGLVPYFVFEIPLEENQGISNVDITNISEESILLKEIYYNDLQADITDAYKQEIYYKTTDGKNIAVILFPLLKRNILNHVIDKLISFDLQYEVIEDGNISTHKDTQVFNAQSAMENGEWFQFQIVESGVYKLSYEAINQAGIDVSNFSSSQIKMYGFGGMIAEFNNDYRYADIPEIAIKMVDGGDGSFNAGDYILFYAQGPDTWVYNEDDDVFNHHLNIYSRLSYYYLVLSEGDGLRIQETNSSANANFTVNKFADFDVIEDETYNLINSGRRWFGDKYEFTTDYTYEFNFDNISSGSTVFLKAVVAARSTTSSRFSISTLGQTKSIGVKALSGGSYASYAEGGDGFWNFNYSGNSSTIPIAVSYNQPLTGSVGWLDFLEINVTRDLKFTGAQMSFRSPESVKPKRISNFIVENPNGNTFEVWEISDITNPAKVKLKTNANSVDFTLATDDLREFIAYNSTLSPSYVKKIGNQNLHAELNHEYIIITHPSFLSQAEELAQFHRDYSNMDVFVTTLEPIYHEYSSGKQDVGAIRDFIRSVYENSVPGKRLKYVLLFGDASMDYLNREANNTNMVPTWESYESFDPISSIATDDFFAFLDENEGDLIYDEVNIGIGRFPVINAEEAQQMVDKVKHYKSNEQGVMADWRNTICFIADDEDNNLHLDQANDLSILVDSIYPTANLDKIFADSYQQESTPAGQRYPKVNAAINERVDKGALIISYTGHGGEVGWGQERFLDVPDITSWTNYNNLSVFLTATCEFARYDDPARVSAGELIFLNDEGGGISLFTTARATYAGSNFVVSTNFYKAALRQRDGNYPRMGDIIKSTKLASGSGTNVQKFILLGDPALTLSMPKYDLNVTAIENTLTGQAIDTIKALSKITIRGNVLDENQSVLTKFNGFVYPAIYDKPTEVTTLGNDAGSPVYTFKVQKNILYKGKADVVNGEFEFSFIVPKDIAYRYGKGKISLYAENSDVDATGFDREIIIGGYDDNNTEDNDGPQIQLYINGTNFQEGGITNENPVLLAYLSDDNGINTTGNGIGHDISAVLDFNENNIKVLNDYYIADANSYKSGAISFPYFNLADGEHTIELKVWDIHNNSNKSSIKFTVASSTEMALNQLFNYPNPIADYTTFSFEHNQSDQNLEITIDIYNSNGKFVTQLKETLFANGYRNNEIKWDATDAYGNRITKGIYIYKVFVKSELGLEAYKTSKLVVIK